jgi:hypothetical protein
MIGAFFDLVSGGKSNDPIVLQNRLGKKCRQKSENMRLILVKQADEFINSTACLFGIKRITDNQLIIRH